MIDKYVRELMNRTTKGRHIDPQTFRFSLIDQLFTGGFAASTPQDNPDMPTPGRCEIKRGKALRMDLRN